jgi:hypothetical protein
MNRMFIRLLPALLVFAGAIRLCAQELTCQVQINTSQVQGTTNKQIFTQLETAIFEFMNNRKWTNEIYSANEKIECSIFITIKESLGGDEYSGTIQVSSRRPVYKSSYYSQILNIEDDKFQFKFQQFSQLEFNINVFQNNLTSVLAYYAYVILATDYDSFAPMGGSAYWQKAQEIVNNAQNAPEPGWRSSEQGNKNRYWLVENTLQPLFKGIRECHYAYAMKGLDLMYQSADDGRTAILKSLDLLVPVAQNRPASFNMQVFFQAKRDELINIFRGATPEEKTKVLETLMTVDPSGTTRYSKIQG